MKKDSHLRVSSPQEPECAPGKGLRIETLPLSALVPDPANVRLHDDRNLDAIRGSLARFGQQKPIVIDSAGVIRAGNGTYQAAKALGWETIDVVRTSLEGLEAAAFAIADNRTSDLSTFDDAALATLLQSLRLEDALEGVGFDEREIDELLAGLDDAADGSLIDDPGAGDPPKQPVTQLGDLWILGPHRLLCGDSTKPDDLERLMAGQTAALLATDPPYLVDYTAGNHPPSSCNRPETANKGWDAYKDPQTGIAFFDSFLKTCLPHVRQDAGVYQWHASKRQSLVEQAWEQNGLLVHQTIVWVKARAVLTRSMYMWRHEPCFFGWRQGHMPPKDRRPPCNQSTVWEIDQAGEERPDHPTPKPLEIFTRPQQYHTRRGEICLEPFSGSGSQLIAAQATDRRCFAMELAPGYVDVAVRRWEKATGREAVLDEGGATFALTAKARGVEVAP
jgi:DNA modification methylase